MMQVNTPRTQQYIIVDFRNSQPLLYFAPLRQEREEAESMWAADGQSVVRREEDEKGAAARNARSQAPLDRSKGRGRVTGARDEL